LVEFIGRIPVGLAPARPLTLPFPVPPLLTLWK